MGLNMLLDVKLFKQYLAHSKPLCVRVLLATVTIELHQIGLRKFTVYETGSGRRLASRLIDPVVVPLCSAVHRLDSHWC